ncbi:MAG TPA: hypothetical protein DEV64_07895 [Rhodospirillaceae bacterium]|nr:hypothetical protein [Rhodospirillaceae bacterium]|tara:strand:- start:280 stop:504 length:225 start_codon:yes stop_codon:yes gene_type:complete
MWKIRIPAILVVCHALQPVIFLKANDITVGQVSNFVEFFTIKVAGFGVDTCLYRSRWPQKTADARRRNGGSIGR